MKPIWHLTVMPYGKKRQLTALIHRPYYKYAKDKNFGNLI